MTNWRMAGLGAVALMAFVSEACGGQGQPQRGPLPGALARPIAAYTGNDFVTLVNGLNYTGGQERVRRCNDSPACNGTQRTRVRIDAVATEDSLGVANLPQFGVVAAKLVVLGNNSEAMYGIRPNGPTGQYSYYLIVFRDSTGARARWRLEEVRVQGTTRTHRMHRTGTFTPCTNPTHPWQAGARADFRSCQQPAAAAPLGGVMFINASFGSAVQGVDPPIWVSCAYGCCLADGS